jgi:nitrate reductase assembly molybdenum cofactor insertion protein NarJ
VIRFRRGRFHDLVQRQLDILAADESALLDEAQAAEDTWNRAGRDEAEEAYGDWQVVADAIAERLLDLRETYAATLDGAAAAEYRTTFDRAAASRFRRFTGLLD